MNEETPFNPVIPPDLKMHSHDDAADRTTSKSTNRSASRRTNSRTQRKPRVNRYSRSSRRFARKAKTSWTRIKSDVQARLARLNNEQLKQALLACGIAVAAVLLIIALAKHTVLIAVLLAVLGVATVLRLWNKVTGGI